MGNVILQKSTDRWDPEFPDRTPRLFTPLAPLARQLAALHPDDWPTLDDYNSLLLRQRGTVTSAVGAAIRFVPQDGKPLSFDCCYEPRIYLHGEIQTRTENWHDFFQVLVWTLFPKTKRRLNELHYHSARQRHQSGRGNRGPRENMLTLFDECGALVISSDRTLLSLIENFRWQELFWTRRAQLRERLRCIVFGHALYEKALNPYLGMTAQALLFHVDGETLEAGPHAQHAMLDSLLDEYLATRRTSLTPACLSPFPLLGMPGWHPGNDVAAFYDNRAYFRDGRNRVPANRHT